MPSEHGRKGQRRGQAGTEVVLLVTSPGCRDLRLNLGAVGRVIYDFGEVEFPRPNGKRARIIMRTRGQIEGVP